MQDDIEEIKFDEPISELAPVHFFQLEVDCYSLPSSQVFPSLNPKNSRKYLLPSTEALCDQFQFADIALGWNREGLEALVTVRQPFSRVEYPNVTAGDSVELFIDTRDVKTSGFNTRFCHHFFFLPEAVDGTQMGELTRFRTEDSHELCDPSELLVQSHINRKGYTLNIFIPSQCLHGYDPEQCDHLGFTYRVNRANEDPQDFSVTTEDYPIEQQPSLWSSLKLLP